MTDAENTENAGTENTGTDNANTDPEPKKEKKKKRTRKSKPVYAAFVVPTEIEGIGTESYVKIPDQEDYTSVKDVKDFLKDLIENDAYASAFDAYAVIIFKPDGEPMKVRKETKTTISFD